MDVVGDFITILRNAGRTHKASCCVQWSALKDGIAKIFKDNGYIKDFSKEQTADGHVVLKVFLKYVNGIAAITEIGRLGKPGRRQYASKEKIPSILGGMGECVLSTSRGILSGKAAKQLGVGGELICYVL
ncbi:MAG: 30S ribosomal protein S8 [Puniceicoccales bacterium]|jgi:small subunit ribosomal protein S8|nr:30S ribosomal protein S8 [Puniceicoccales bacterium]